MWHLDTWFGGGLGPAGLMVGLRDLFQPKWCYDSRADQTTDCSFKRVRTTRVFGSGAKLNQNKILHQPSSMECWCKGLALPLATTNLLVLDITLEGPHCLQHPWVLLKIFWKAFENLGALGGGNTKFEISRPSDMVLVSKFIFDKCFYF